MFRVTRNVLNCPLLLSPSVGGPSTPTTKGRILPSLCNPCGWTFRIGSTAQLEINFHSSVKHNHEFYSRMAIIRPPLQIYIYIMLILRYALRNKAIDLLSWNTWEYRIRQSLIRQPSGHNNYYGTYIKTFVSTHVLPFYIYIYIYYYYYYKIFNKFTSRGQHL